MNKQLLIALMVSSIVSMHAMDLEQGNTPKPQFNPLFKRAIDDNKPQDFQSLIDLADKAKLKPHLSTLKQYSQEHQAQLGGIGTMVIVCNVVGGIGTIGAVAGVTAAAASGFTSIETMTYLGTGLGLGIFGTLSCLTATIIGGKRRAKANAQQEIQQCIAAAEAVSETTDTAGNEQI